MAKTYNNNHRNYNNCIYIWQRKDWPVFRWNAERLIVPLAEVSQSIGVLAGQMSLLGFGEKNSAQLEAITGELMSSSAIEGVVLNADSVRSSVARKLGIELNGEISTDHYVDGVVDVMLDALKNSEAKLTAERLFDWHAALFPYGRSGMHKVTVADWRRGEEPMQVVSGAMGHEKVHYVATPSASVPLEMEKFLDWINACESEQSPILKSAIAHLWFVTIHPFDDGNGRIGRTIADMMMSRGNNTKHRYFSMSAEILRHKKSYYEILEQTQKGNLDITEWLLWYITALKNAIENAEGVVDTTLKKSRYWDNFRTIEINERQRKVVNRLWDGFEGKLTTVKWAKMCHVSRDTALRDIQDLVNKRMLKVATEGGRSTNYLLADDYE